MLVWFCRGGCLKIGSKVAVVLIIRRRDSNTLHYYETLFYYIKEFSNRFDKTDSYLPAN